MDKDPGLASIVFEKVLFQDVKNIVLVGMGKNLVTDFKDRALVAATLATTAAQIDLSVQLVTGDEFLDDFKVAVITTAETGTAHADDDLFFHKIRSPRSGADSLLQPPCSGTSPFPSTHLPQRCMVVKKVTSDGHARLSLIISPVL